MFGISWLGGRKAKKVEDFSASYGEGGDDKEPSTGIAGFFERPVVLVVLGILALVGLTSGVYLMFFRPDPVTIASRVYNIPLPTPTFSPVAVSGESDFVGALPVADIAYGLRTAEPSVMRPVRSWPTRFAEEWLLTYDDGAGKTMTVQAVQHYSLDSATLAYEGLLNVATAEAAKAASASPSPAATPNPAPSTSANPADPGVPGITMGVVNVNKVEVGKSFKVVKEVTESVPNPAGGDATPVTHQVGVVTWQNGTAVFVMTADPAVIDDLFTEYGL